METAEDDGTLERLTGSRGDMMMRFRDVIVRHVSHSAANREALFVSTGLFKRMVWLIRQTVTDLSAINRQAAIRED